MILRTHFSRIVTILVVLEICFGALIGRLFLIQSVYSEELQARSERQRQTQMQSQIKRGKILDRDQSVFAISRNLVSVYADPKTMKAHPHEVARKLIHLLETPESELLLALRKKNRRFVWLQRNLDYDRLEEIRKITRSIRGLGYQIHGKRFYPRNDRACHIIGYTNYANEGIEGVEHQYDTHLTPQELKSKFITTDAKKRPISPPELYQDTLAYGYNVVLTLDEYIQYIAEKELVAGCRKWRAQSGSAIVMHSKSGEILGLANYPNYNLNHYSQSKESAKRNLAIWNQYEPGSVFKIVTASAVINEKLMLPKSREYCEMGEYRLPNGHIIHDIKPNAWLTLSEIIYKSSNIGIIKVASHLGKVELEDYIRRFGFGEKTGVDMPYEKAGSLRGLRYWDDYSIASVPFGQGISVTPIQMLNAINAIATRGVLLQPYVTQKILDSDGQPLKRFHPKPIRRVISPETAKTVTEMLVQVTEVGGGMNGRVKGYRVAGKTGTAQKAERGKGYVKGKVVTTFAGFLPADDPLISIIVVLDEPAGAPLSSRVAAPIFQKIADQAMRYLTQKDLFAQSATGS
jgi:cell division protein FtsI (penicillin-binding protein 3)